MPDINPVKNNLTVQELNRRSSLAESTWDKIGGSINFINDRQAQHYQFNLNGRYGQVGVSALTRFDGGHVVKGNEEVYGVAMYNGISGSSGTSTIDIRVIRGGSDIGSLFGTLPSIDFNSPNDAKVIRDFINAVDSSDTGTTLPTLSGLASTLVIGDVLRADLTSVMTGAETVNIIVMTRPR